MDRKTGANKKTTTPSTPVFESDRFRTEKNQDTYDKFNIYRLVQAERKVILDELNGEIRRNFETRGWLPLLDVKHPPPPALIRKFYSNLSVHSDDSNTQYVRSWIRGEEYVITPFVVAIALGVSLVQQPVYPYTETPSLDDIMSLLVLPLDGVLILKSPPMSLLSSIICFSRFLVIPFGLSLIYTLFLSRDVCFCTLSSLMLLSIFLLFLLALQLRFIGIVQNLMVFSFQFFFIRFCYTQVQRIFLLPRLFILQLPQVPPSLGKEWLR